MGMLTVDCATKNNILIIHLFVRIHSGAACWFPGWDHITFTSSCCILYRACYYHGSIDMLLRIKDDFRVRLFWHNPRSLFAGLIFVLPFFPLQWSVIQPAPGHTFAQRPSMVTKSLVFGSDKPSQLYSRPLFFLITWSVFFEERNEKGLLVEIAWQKEHIYGKEEEMQSRDGAISFRRWNRMLNRLIDDSRYWSLHQRRCSDNA